MEFGSVQAAPRGRSPLLEFPVSIDHFIPKEIENHETRNLGTVG